MKRMSAEIKVPQESTQVLYNKTFFCTLAFALQIVTLVLLLKLEDGMNRQLTTEVVFEDNGAHLARELVCI